MNAVSGLCPSTGGVDVLERDVSRRAEGPPAEVRRDPRVIASYVGRERRPKASSALLGTGGAPRSTMPIVRRIVSRTVVALAVLGGAGGLTACDPPPPDCAQVISQYADVPAVNLTVENAEKAVFCLTNQQRANQGVSPAYVRRAKLDTAARKHADAAVAQKWWVNGADPHVNPIGNTTPSSRVRAEGYCPSGTWRNHEYVYLGWG